MVAEKVALGGWTTDGQVIMGAFMHSALKISAKGPLEETFCVQLLSVAEQKVTYQSTGKESARNLFSNSENVRTTGHFIECNCIVLIVLRTVCMHSNRKPKPWLTDF